MCVPSAKACRVVVGLGGPDTRRLSPHFRCNKTSSLGGLALAGTGRDRVALLIPGAEGRADENGEPADDDATGAELDGAIAKGSAGAAIMGGGAALGWAGPLVGATRTAGAPSSVVLGGSDRLRTDRTPATTSTIAPVPAETKLFCDPGVLGLGYRANKPAPCAFHMDCGTLLSVNG